jgi:hypothetical protein
MDWEELARVKESLRIKHIADAFLQLQVFRGKDHPHKFLFLQTNAVFASERSTCIDAGTQNVTTCGKDTLDFILVALIKKNNRMQVAIAGVEDIGNP